MDKMTKSTKTFTNSENPFFNEYFVFEFHCTLTELLRLTILFELKKSMTYKKNLIVGELLVDLHSVWNQPYHSYFKKWGRLETPIGAKGEGVSVLESHGHLQIDLAIVSQHNVFLSAIKPDDAEELKKPLVEPDYEDIESNLLQHSSSLMPSNIRYFIGLYRGYFRKKGNYMIQVSFAGFNGKTQVAKQTTTPIWNHELTFAWMYPSLSQRFLILIFAHEHMQWKCVADYEISFEEIALNAKPSLGPTYLHFYDPVNPLNYIGRLLMDLRSEFMAEEQPSHVLITQSIAGLDESRYWRDDIFLIEFLPLMGDHIHTNANNYKLSVSLAEHTSNIVEGQLKTPMGKFHTTIHTKYFRQEAPYPSCLFRVRLPNHRSKYDSDYFMTDLVNYMSAEVETFKVFQLKFTHQYESQAKCLKSIITDVLNKIKEGISSHRFEIDADTQRTTWDINRQLYLLNYFTKLSQELRELRHTLRCCFREVSLDESVSDVVLELQRLIGEVNSLINTLRVQDEWPELILTLSAAGKEVGVCRLNAKHFLKPHPKKQSPLASSQCWKVKSFVFRSVACNHSCANCGCNAAIILGCISIVIERERKEFLSSIASEWTLTKEEPVAWQPKVRQTRFRCQVYVHQAKVRPTADKNNFCDGYLRTLFGEQVAETYTSPGTHSPIWNAVTTLKGLTLPGSIGWYLQNPPVFSMEYRNTERTSNDDHVAKGYITASVISAEDHVRNTEREEAAAGLCWTRSPVQKFQRLKHITPPPLKWLPVALKGIVWAEVLMSVELIELVHQKPEEKDVILATGIPAAIRPNMLYFALEVIFVGFRSYGKTSLGSAGKRRAKVMMGDLVLMSGLSGATTKNSINFIASYACGVVVEFTRSAGILASHDSS
ncbi:uncharacterized protein LOC6638750 isoform X4 [Drosophila willistoni]|uniref:uncharacterized protein LOC6638750 isoform X4 n=1 Tax=Drosophila willistoni TaxID=7260 RepID=UPI001F072ED9|nr:uncharacterized protein LOC6638750 isoform X4 [Drosophila willistoni]